MGALDGQHVLVTGGSSGIPALRQRIAAQLPKARVVEGDPEAVGLVIDLAAYRRDRKAAPADEDDTDDPTDLSAIAI